MAQHSKLVSKNTIESAIRQRIDTVRLLCVLMMIYVHVPNGATQELDYSIDLVRLDYWIEAFLIEGPGRAGAALLSVVSGYLVAHMLLMKRKTLVSIYQRRFMSTLVPMALWAMIICSIYKLCSGGRYTFVDEATTWLDHINLILFLTQVPYGATMHLGFLRDLFVCVLLSPLLLAGIRFAAPAFLTMLAIAYIFEHEQRLVVILRPLIIFGFSLGLFIAVRGYRLDKLDRYYKLFCSLAVVSTLCILWVNSGGLQQTQWWFAQYYLSLSESVLYPACRLFGSLAIWTMIPHFLGGNKKPFLLRFSPYVFAAFCSHTLLLAIAFNGAWQPLLGGREANTYIIWFLSAPLLAFIMAIAVVHSCKKMLPTLASLITGGRLSARSFAS